MNRLINLDDVKYQFMVKADTPSKWNVLAVSKSDLEDMAKEEGGNMGIYVKHKKLTGTAITPTQGTKKAAGYDLYVDMFEDEVQLQPGETRTFFSGIAFEIPDGYTGLVFSRSGLSTRNQLLLINGAGVIDSDYRGNVGIPLHNLSNEVQTIRNHQRIAQIVFVPAPIVSLIEVDKLSDTDRGTGGFGSTGS